MDSTFKLTAVRKELWIYYYETTGQGVAHEEQIINPSEQDEHEAQRKFFTWSNCYMVKMKYFDKNDNFCDEVLYKRNIEL